MNNMMEKYRIYNYEEYTHTHTPHIPTGQQRSRHLQGLTLTLSGILYLIHTTQQYERLHQHKPHVIKVDNTPLFHWEYKPVLQAIRGYQAITHKCPRYATIHPPKCSWHKPQYRRKIKGSTPLK